MRGGHAEGMNRITHHATDTGSRRRPEVHRPAQRSLRSRLALPLAVLAVPVGTALGGALLAAGPPPAAPTTDPVIRIGCATGPSAGDTDDRTVLPAGCPGGRP
jgi:hypothetical protein